MRIKVNINEPNEALNNAALQTWVESHADDVENYFVVATQHHSECLTFRFVYKTVLGCHRLFIYDPIDDTLCSFFAEEDFTDIGRWIFEKCDEYFGCNYEMLM